MKGKVPSDRILKSFNVQSLNNCINFYTRASNRGYQMSQSCIGPIGRQKPPEFQTF